MRQMDLDATGMEFTRGWFRKRNLATFREYVYPQFAGKPTLYLELGVFEGQSMAWMLQHVLTHPESKAVGVDPWLMTDKLDSSCMDAVRQRAFLNTSNSKCCLIRACSAAVLRKMTKRHGFLGVTLNSVDVSMVDGNHDMGAVYDDCRWVWSLIKPGGWMLLDDVENDIDKDHHVKHGLALFLAEFPEAKQLWKHRYMECYQKP